MSKTLALELKHIRHAYGDVVAVDGFSLSVAAGEVVCLLGPSGCGKTTVLRLAAGLEALQQGTVAIGGRVVADTTVNLPPERRGIGFVFQDYALFPHLTVAENIAFGLDGSSMAERRACVDSVLTRVGMPEYRDRYPHALSGGQQQRVALARALVPEPPVILLDEPFSGLDARMRERVRDETLHVLKESGLATLMVTHDAEEAMFMGDRIAVMRDGRLIQAGPPDMLYCNPADAFVTQFFGEVNRLKGIVRNGIVETPLGPLPSRNLADGATAEVLIRPEALRLGPAMDAAHAGATNRVRVIASRMLGRSSLIHLCLCGRAGYRLHLHSRMPGRYLPAEDEELAVELDTTQAFVFPANTD